MTVSESARPVADSIYCNTLLWKYLGGEDIDFNDFFKADNNGAEPDFNAVMLRINGGMKKSDEYFTALKRRYTSPDQGWKLHIGAKTESAFRVAKVCLPILFENKINCKVVRSTEYLEVLKTKNEGTQKGKFITIYPKNEKHAVEIAEMLDRHLTDAGFTNIDFDAPPYDACYGNTRGIFVRYGAFNSNGNLYQVDQNENLVLFNGKKLRISDNRNTYKPDFITWNPFGDKLTAPVYSNTSTEATETNRPHKRLRTDTEH